MVPIKIPMDKIMAVGLSTAHLKLKDTTYSDKILEEIKKLMNQYDIDLPIVETKLLNKVLIP